MKSSASQSESSNHISEKLWNSQYIKAMGGNFLLFFSFYLLTPLLPIYLDAQFKADKDTIGFVLSGYVIAALIVRPFSGFIVDSFDRKKVLMISFLVFFVCFTGYIGAASILFFALIRTIHGIPFGATTVANSTVAIDVLPSARRNEGIGYYGLSNNLAMAFAPSVGIWIYGLTGNFELLFWISLITSLLGFICVSQIKMPYKREVKKDKLKFSLDHFFLTRAWLLAVNIAFFGLCWGVMSNYVAIYGQEKLNITDGTGLFFMLLSAGLVISRLHGASSLRKGYLTRNCIQGLMISVCAYTLFAASINEYTYYISALLLGLGNGRMYPAFLNMFISTARHDQRGTANSSILTSWDIGMGLGMLVGGILVEYCGYGTAFWFTAAVQLCGTLLFIIATRRFFRSRSLTDAK